MSNSDSYDDADKNIQRLRCYVEGADLIFQNAVALYNEAQLLGKSGHFARATVLHQISMEECSKIDSLGAAVISLLNGHGVDEDRLAKAFRNHKAKNYANSYFAVATEEELAARGRGDWKAASKAFKQFQSKFHSEVNTIKNAGLYVDFQNGQFTAPADEVNETVTVDFQSANAFYLNHSHNFLRLMGKIVSDPNLYGKLTKDLLAHLKGLRAAEADLQQMQDALMSELIANHKDSTAK